jgi:fatty acid desaturase
VLWAWVLPISVSGILATIRLMREHTGELTQEGRRETILSTTNNHGLSGASRLLVSPRNIGFHITHHLHPQVGLEYLPALERWYQDQPA